MRLRFLPVTAAMFLVAAQIRLAAQTPLGSDFTYQGQLKASGMPAITTADFKYSLFNDVTAGAQVGATLSKDNVSLVGGLFTLPLDFGAAAFNGEARWIEVQVRSPAGSGAFTTLAPRQPLTAVPYALQSRGLVVDATGNLGIGTAAPASKLHVEGGAISVFNQGDQVDALVLGIERSWAFRQQGTGAGTALKLQSVSGGGNKNFLIDTTGFVGIGTVSPQAKLDVNGGAISVSNAGDQFDALVLGIERSWVFRQHGTAETTALKLQSIGGGGNKNFLIDTTGSVGIGTLDPQAKLDVNGTARVKVLEITGADLAEKFPASETLEPGMVVAIDTRNAGKLCLARGAYNRCVAGVVSGANNFSVGAVLGNLPGHDDAPAIALSGRVYVYCDATHAAIQPGDLLTTSDRAGHAMKATDRDRSHGAVIGKAMTALESGRGMVLVLVNLQ